MLWLRTNRYWLLLAVFVGCEFARRQGYDNFVLAAGQDALLIGLLALNRRMLTWHTGVTAVFALAVVLLHSASLGIPLMVGVFGARGLVYIVATAEVLSRRVDPTPHLRSGRPLLVVAGLMAGVALLQLATGFRYEAQAYYNAATINAEDDAIRLPSLFYNFATFAKFSVCAAIVATAQISGSLSRGVPLARATSWLLVMSSSTVAVVLSGQRAGFLAIVCLGGWLVLRHASGRVVLSAAMASALALLAVNEFAPSYGIRSMTVFSADSPDRIQATVFDSIPRAIEAFPTWTGLGMGRSTAAAIRYDYEYGTQWAVLDYYQLTWSGSEGVMHSALQNGGVPWFLATLAALGWALLQPGLVVRAWVAVFGIWALTHDIWGSSQHYLLMLLLALAVQEQTPKVER